MKRFLFYVLVLKVVVFSLIWQGCDPPPVELCEGEQLLSASASISYQPSNGALLVMADPATTCSQEAANEEGCHLVSFGYLFEYLDCYGNVLFNRVADVWYVDNDDSNLAFDWQLDDEKEGTIAGADGTLLYPLDPPTALQFASYKHLRLSFYTFPTNIYDCQTVDNQPPSSVYSLDFGADGEELIHLFESEVLVGNANQLEQIIYTTDLACE